MSEAYSFSLVCDEFDQFNELSKDWDTDFRALSSSPAENIQLFQSHSGQTQVSFAHFGLAVNQRALAPQETRNIAILPPKHPDLFWCGKHITGGQVLLFNKSGEMESISKEGFEVFSLSVPEQWISQIFSTNPSIQVGSEEQVIQCKNNKIGHFYTQLSTLSATLKLATASDKSYQTLQDATLFEGLASLLEPASPHPFSLAKERRMKVLGDALDFIHAKRERVTLSEICYHTNTSERTLERVFSSTIGISPKKYLNRYLLQEARLCFLKSDSCNTTVMSVAHKFGFSHMGQFTASYRKLFGERPSETLKNVKHHYFNQLITADS